ncbi:hypothetical protein Tco_0266020 [Tanacetum coccineum]
METTVCVKLKLKLLRYIVKKELNYLVLALCIIMPRKDASSNLILKGVFRHTCYSLDYSGVYRPNLCNCVSCVYYEPEETTKVSEQQQRWLCIELQPLKLAIGQQPLKPHTVATGQGLPSSLLCQIMSKFHRSLEIVENDGYTKKLCLEHQHLQVARELPSLSILSSLAVYYANLTKYSNL